MWRVLLADPDRHEQERLTRACARFGRVICVSTAARLWRELAVRGADLIVLEHRLPDGSGLDLLAVLKARRPEVPRHHGDGRRLGGRVRRRAEAGHSGLLHQTVGTIRDRRVATTNSGRPPYRGETTDGTPSACRAGLRAACRLREEGDAVAIRQAAQRIQEDLEDPVSFGQLALELRLSKPALSRRFTRTIGISYRRLVNDARIARARELLRSSSYSVTEIAQLVGFGDLARFDKVFKAAVGASPSLYRQQQTSEGNKLPADSTGSVRRRCPVEMSR